MIKDRDFYNKESRAYSSKRYPEAASTYVQFFFKERLRILMALLEDIFRGGSSLSLLEIGCADGVVLREIAGKMPGRFADMTGIDTAEDMIAAAKSMTPDPKIAFFVRGNEQAEKRSDVILEIGVANYADFDAELAHARSRINAGGIYLLSIAGKNSLNSMFGRGTGYANFLSYGEYESRISKIFEIKRASAVGIFAPFVWAAPSIGRIIQPALEFLFRPFPNLFHEKIYVLAAK
jgi:2-polyprenyl-3-methyl-5-hydroxy-6-metoxy-1,4-benzoquinol methylase